MKSTVYIFNFFNFLELFCLMVSEGVGSQFCFSQLRVAEMSRFSAKSMRAGIFFTSFVRYPLSVIRCPLSVISYRLSVISYWLSVISPAAGLKSGQFDLKTDSSVAESDTRRLRSGVESMIKSSDE